MFLLCSVSASISYTAPEGGIRGGGRGRRLGDREGREARRQGQGAMTRLLLRSQTVPFYCDKNAIAVNA